jgi:hypothetical protein
MIRSSVPQPKANLPHPGISMHRIRAVYNGVGDGPGVFLTAAGAILVCLIGLPRARWFLLGSILFGLALMVGIRAWYRHRAVEVKRLSILR